MSKGYLTSAVVALLLLTAVDARSQRLSGDIEGIVKDSSGALIPSVSITITSIETSAERTLVTDDYGHFLAALLPIGEYDVRAELQGFRAWAGKTLVKTGKRISINITLTVGNITEEVTVETPAGQLINPNDAQIAMSIDEKRVQDLPLPSSAATPDPPVLPPLP